MEPSHIPSESAALKAALDWRVKDALNSIDTYRLVTTELIPRDKDTLAYTVFVRRPRKGELPKHPEK